MLVQVAIEQLRSLLMQSKSVAGIVDRIQLTRVLPPDTGALSSDQVSEFFSICEKTQIIAPDHAMINLSYAGSSWKYLLL